MLSVLLVSCGGDNSATSGSMSCTATGTVLSGSVVAGTSVQVSNVNVSILNGTGPFTIALPGLGAVSSATAYYTYPSTLTLVADSAGGLGSVTVTDTSSNASAICGIYNYSGTGGTTGNINVAVSPSTTIAVGSTAVLTASLLNAATTATFSFTSATAGVTVQTVNGNTAYVTSTVATTAIITVSLTSGGTTTTTGYQSVTLTFTNGGTSTGALTCQLRRGSGGAETYYVGQTIYYQITTSTGETAQITQWDAGETWDYPPTYPISPNPYFTVSYSVPNQWKHVYITARGATSGAFCNNGLPMEDWIFVNGYY